MIINYTSINTIIYYNKILVKYLNKVCTTVLLFADFMFYNGV